MTQLQDMRTHAALGSILARVMYDEWGRVAHIRKLTPEQLTCILNARMTNWRVWASLTWDCAKQVMAWSCTPMFRVDEIGLLVRAMFEGISPWSRLSDNFSKFTPGAAHYEIMAQAFAQQILQNSWRSSAWIKKILTDKRGIATLFYEVFSPEARAYVFKQLQTLGIFPRNADGSNLESISMTRDGWMILWERILQILLQVIGTNKES